MNVNNLEKFRKKLEGETICLGMVVWLTDPSISEIAGDAGLDFTWIDMEHGALNIETVQEHVRAARGTDMASLVRVPWNDPVLIKPILDFAPAGVIIPMVNTKEEAEKAVASCRYPPEGVRGCGVRRGTRYGAEPFGEYLDKSNNGEKLHSF
jgi:2-keto-3-deoxy-L-rhamnonate aldolase RhmA